MTAEKIPVFLLKTQSAPADAYQEVLSRPGNDGLELEPTFVPVLEHRLDEDGMQTVRSALQARRVGKSSDAAYGGLIFTSQRAVEAFATLVAEGDRNSDSNSNGAEGDESWPHLQDVPVYSVGPATTRSLRAIPQAPPLQIFGEHTGNGAALARYMLEHYGQWYRDRAVKPPILFLVGEQRRDIIPKTLMDPSLPDPARIRVDEVVVYGTGVMQSFMRDFEERLHATDDRRMRWVVVFSPTGCDAMLRALGWLGHTDTISQEPSRRRTWVATIGPTTRDFLVSTFAYEPDVCAETPSPEGVRQGIAAFIHSTADSGGS